MELSWSILGPIWEGQVLQPVNKGSLFFQLVALVLVQVRLSASLQMFPSLFRDQNPNLFPLSGIGDPERSAVWSRGLQGGSMLLNL